MYAGTLLCESDTCARAQTLDSVHPASNAALTSPEYASTRGVESSDALRLMGFSHASFQKIRHPAWHPPCACPSQRVWRWTARATRRPRVGKTVSQVLCARLWT